MVTHGWRPRCGPVGAVRAGMAKRLVRHGPRMGAATMALWTALRYSGRSLTRTPALALTLLLTIAVGIGANTAVAGFVRGLATRDLPIPRIETVVSIFAKETDGTFSALSYDGYLALEARRDMFESLGAARESRASIIVNDASWVMSVASVTPEIGALFRLPTGDGVVISHRVWQEAFDARPDVRGVPIRIEGAERRVIGVAPPWLEGLYIGSAVDVWMPLHQTSVRWADRRSRTFWVVGRLRPGISRVKAQAAFDAAPVPAEAVAVLPYTGMTPDVAAGMLRIARLLPAAAVSVFLVGCANVAVLLLSRASARSRETSVRLALGATRRRLAGQMLADSVLISVTGGACGLLLAAWTAGIVPALLFAEDAERLVFAPDPATVVAAWAACVGTTIACGLVPLFEIRHDEAGRVLQRESAGPSKAMRRLRAGLVFAQMTCCSVLVIATGLLLSGFSTALQTSAGHRLGQPILATLRAPGGFDRPDLWLGFFREAERAVRSLPGISATAWVARLPGSLPVWQSIRVEPPQLPLRDVVLDVTAFTPPRSLALVVLPPIAGRMFGGGDMPRSCRVAIVNREAATELFGGDAVGQSIEDPAGQCVQVVGVVGTRKPAGGSAGPGRPAIYYYAEQTATPLGHDGPARFRVPAPSEPARGVLDANVVSAGYFGVMGLTRVAGAVFSDDVAPHSCRVGVLNEEAAELYFGGRAVGGAIIDDSGERTEIVGVVRSPLLRSSERRVQPAIYYPMAQDVQPRMTLILAAREATGAMVASVRQRLDEMTGGPPGRLIVTTLDAHLSATALATDRIATTLVGACAAAALMLGVVGLYGAVADAVRHRRREIAVRVALGAPGWCVVRLVLADGVRLAGAGTIAGMLGSLAVARWLTQIMPNAGSPTSCVWLAAPLVLTGVVAVASALPARWALGTDPLAIMRDE